MCVYMYGGYSTCMDARMPPPPPPHTFLLPQLLLLLLVWLTTTPTSPPGHEGLSEGSSALVLVKSTLQQRPTTSGARGGVSPSLPLPCNVSGCAVWQSDLPQRAAMVTAKRLGMMPCQSSSSMELRVTTLTIPLLALHTELHQRGKWSLIKLNLPTFMLRK